ncbi:SPOR domain-containing protein [Ichthyenterobacterium sp. W332]|uniref:SPOR domain-containing protein n=1 Tax=Microcosmobacter mediterraneus TaxID=3075607 RepID=A0ABU2YHT8_9FLAO|nr:SPOR domain-containing protein [Ichthyenterobacterium sp. W332]MDT0557736.1 SPOR domain-containing protein [Ichthyenterobacterium sp. W332]
MQKTSIKLFIISILMLCFFKGNAQSATVTIDQDSDISKLLEYKKDLKTAYTYKIQVYQGNRTNAERVKSEFLNAYGEWSVSMEWNTPNYKIWVGNFRSRLEADRALQKIKRKYANAFIFKPKKDKKK